MTGDLKYLFRGELHGSLVAGANIPPRPANSRDKTKQVSQNAWVRTSRSFVVTFSHCDSSVEGIDPRQTSFPMRQVFKKVRKMLGRDRGPSAARVLDKCARRMAAGAENGGPTTAADALDAADRGAGRVSVLNRCQFCRGQNVRFER